MTFTIRPRSLLIAAVIAVLAIGAGVAYATIPDSAGVIHGCYDKKGQLSVIDPSAGDACKKNETSLDWSQTGPQGPQGIQGPQGPQGIQGPQGNPGAPATINNLSPIFVSNDNCSIGENDEESCFVFCPSGSVVTGGGYFLTDHGLDDDVIGSHMFNNGWVTTLSTGFLEGGGSWHTDATCLKFN